MCVTSDVGASRIELVALAKPVPTNTLIFARLRSFLLSVGALSRLHTPAPSEAIGRPQDSSDTVADGDRCECHAFVYHSWLRVLDDTAPLQTLWTSSLVISCAWAPTGFLTERHLVAFAWNRAPEDSSKWRGRGVSS